MSVKITDSASADTVALDEPFHCIIILQLKHKIIGVGFILRAKQIIKTFRNNNKKKPRREATETSTSKASVYGKL